MEKKQETETELLFTVTVLEGNSETSHEVSLDKEDLTRLTPDDYGAIDLVEESFRFLLERESKESILSRFNLTDIGNYFPEFEKEITGRLNQ